MRIFLRLKMLAASAAFLACCLFPSCEKAKSLLGGVEAKAPSRPAVFRSSPLVSQLDPQTYQNFFDQPGRVVIIDFYADGCPACVAISPVLDQIASDYNGLVLVGKVDLAPLPNRELGEKVGVGPIPDVRIYRDGKLMDQFLGFPGEEALREQIKGYTEGLSPIPTPSPAAVQPVISPMSKEWLPPGMSRR